MDLKLGCLFLVFPGQKVDPVSGPSLDERETAYFAARQRIFSEDACDSKLIKERPKKDPVVARRMITRALGQADKGTKHELTKECVELVVEDVKIKQSDEKSIKSSNKMKANPPSGKSSRACTTSKVDKSGEFGSSQEPQQKKNSKGGDSLAEVTPDNYLRQEHVGAAKRLFANALRMHRRDVDLSNKETGS